MLDQKYQLKNTPWSVMVYDIAVLSARFCSGCAPRPKAGCSRVEPCTINRVVFASKAIKRLVSVFMGILQIYFGRAIASIRMWPLNRSLRRYVHILTSFSSTRYDPRRPSSTMANIEPIGFLPVFWYYYPLYRTRINNSEKDAIPIPNGEEKRPDLYEIVRNS